MASFDLFDALISRFGVISNVQAAAPTPGRCRKRLHYYSACIGSGHPGYGRQSDDFIYSAGFAMDSAERARLIAIAEAAERYAGSDILDEPRIWASVDELDGPYLEPSRYPRCSVSEYAHPLCPVNRFDTAARIRWVRGIDLNSAEPIWVPARMACYTTEAESSKERYLVPISTGYAVHTDPVEAVVRGLTEAIERDMLSIWWLQQLPLPPLGNDHFSEVTKSLISWNSEGFVDTHLFDATSDLRVPTVFCVLTAGLDDRAFRTVGAGTGRDLAHAAEKAMAEAIIGREIIQSNENPIPEHPKNFKRLSDGVRYMALAEHASAFDFLFNQIECRPSASKVPALPNDPAEALSEILAAVNHRKMQPVVVDRTPRELADVGLSAVNVIIPDLQPLSFIPLAQFKGHPRLYEAPELMGYPVLREAELNSWPIPFA